MHTITEKQIEGFTCYLTQEERAPATVKMYVRTIGELMACMKSW